MPLGCVGCNVLRPTFIIAWATVCGGLAVTGLVIGLESGNLFNKAELHVLKMIIKFNLFSNGNTVFL